MWVIWPNIAVYSLIVYGGVQLLFVGFFGAQFLLAVLEPNRKKVVTLWRTLFHVHSRAYWLAVAAFVVFALAWNALELWGLPLVEKLMRRRRRGG